MINGQKQIWQIKSPNWMNLQFVHRVAFESKHGWCVRHLKHHSNLTPTNARSMCIWNQPPYQSYPSNTTSFEDLGLNPFYNNLWYKGFFFRDKLAHLCSFRPRRSLQEVEVWPRSRRWGKWHDWCEVWRMTLEHFGTIGRLSMWQHQVCPVCLSRDVATETWGASNPVNLSSHSG